MTMAMSANIGNMTSTATAASFSILESKNQSVGINLRPVSTLTKSMKPSCAAISAQNENLNNWVRLVENIGAFILG